MIFEGRQLIDNHHIEVKGKVGLVNEPLQVLTVDDRDIRLLHEGISEEKTKLTFFRIVIIKELRK